MSTTDEVIRNLQRNSPMTNREIAMQEVNDFKASQKRKWMILGQEYYRNKTKMLEHKRLIIGEGGAQIEALNLANNKLVHGFVRKLVDQKTGYLLSKPFSIQVDGPAEYKNQLECIFGKQFQRQMKNLGKNAINNGIGWLQVYYNDSGEISFKIIPSEEVVPLWKDSTHTELDAIIRFYPLVVYEAKTEKTITIIEFWDTNGVMKFSQDLLVSPNYVVEGGIQGHFVTVDAEGNEQQLSWEHVPFIPFKYNDEEMPIVEMLQSLVDDYDKRMSENANNLEDLPNSIYVVKNYDGQDVQELRRNMSQLRTIKVSGDGGVDTISLEINTEAFENHMDRLRKSIYEFGRGVDTQSDKFGNSPSGISLRFLYGDLDMDVNIIETEFQASLDSLLWFVDQHLYNTTGRDYTEYNVDFIFNRDILINETEAIENVKSSVGIISDETLLVNHPWTTNVTEELGRINKERNAIMDDYPTLGAQDQTPNTKVDDAE